MWEVQVAGEPVFVPDGVLVLQDLPCERLTWFERLVQVVPDYHQREFTAIPCVVGDRFWLQFLDRTHVVDMCGHATFGFLSILEKLAMLPPKMRIHTLCGPVPVFSEPIRINMPSVTNQGFFKEGDQSWPVYSAGNSYVLVRCDDLNRTDVADLQKRSDKILDKSKSYGVVYYELLHIGTEEICSFSVVFFGKRVQRDNSPCGTGSTALAGYLSKQGTLSEGLTLKQYSHFGCFTVMANDCGFTLGCDAEIIVTRDTVRSKNLVPFEQFDFHRRLR